MAGSYSLKWRDAEAANRRALLDIVNLRGPCGQRAGFGENPSKSARGLPQLVLLDVIQSTWLRELVNNELNFWHPVTPYPAN
jgi:hypothetical protein